MPNPTDLEQLDVPQVTQVNLLVNLKKDIPNPHAGKYNPNSISCSATLTVALPPAMGKDPKKIGQFMDELHTGLLHKCETWIEAFRAGATKGRKIAENQVAEGLARIEQGNSYFS